jgi:hypothetical protein
MYKKFKKYHVSIFLQIVRLLKVLVLSPLPARGGRNPKAFLQKKKSQKTHAANCVGGKVTRLVFLTFLKTPYSLSFSKVQKVYL